MIDRKVEPRKKRDFGDVLNVSFAFIGQEYKGLGRTLLTYAGIPVLVYAVLSAVYVDSTFSNFFNMLNRSNASQDIAEMPMKAALVNIINLIVQVFLTGLSYSYIVLYAKKGSGNVDINEVWHKFTTFFGAFIGYNLLTGLVLILAFIALIIPGIYVMVPLSLILIVKVAEDQDYGASFSRCFYLVKDHWWETLGLIFISGIIMAVISGVFSLPAGLVVGAQAILKSDGGSLRIPIMIATIFSTIGTAIITPLPAIVLTFQYYSLVEHKDNTSLLYKIDNINNAANTNIE